MAERPRLFIGDDDAGSRHEQAPEAGLQARPPGPSIEDVAVDGHGRIPDPSVAIAAAQRVANGRGGQVLLLRGTGLEAGIAADEAPARAVAAHDGSSVGRSAPHHEAHTRTTGQRVTSPEVACCLVGERATHRFQVRTPA